MRSFVAMCAVVFVLAAAALAGPIELGTGEHLANLVVNFKDGANYWFSVPFSPGETAENAWLRADELSSLELAYDRYDFGVFINSIAYDGHSHSGYQGGEDWWHQWQRGSAENNWVSGMGISADTLTDGCWDALVYGSANPPEVPAPRRAAPYAAEVVSYTPGVGAGAYCDPNTALGRPTVDTDPDPWWMPDYPAPVVPVYQPWIADELVSIGQGGSLTVAFDHHVVNDPRNPYGLDLILFGNAQQQIGGGNAWLNGNPNNTTVSGSAAGEPGIVSVSQDGQTWHTFANGPYADMFAPTLGRVYDPNDPDESLGAWNLWWGQATDPTKPLDPNLTAGSFAGYTVAAMASAYGRSAGGTGFDIGVFGLGWIQYVRIENPSGSGVVPEIDALADVAAPPQPGDANLDDLVGLIDLDILKANWHAQSGKEWTDGDFTGDGAVTLLDLGLLAINWGWSAPTGPPAAVPEPASCLILAAGAMLALRRRGLIRT